MESFYVTWQVSTLCKLHEELEIHGADYMHYLPSASWLRMLGILDNLISYSRPALQTHLKSNVDRPFVVGQSQHDNSIKTALRRGADMQNGQTSSPFKKLTLSALADFQTVFISAKGDIGGLLKRLLVLGKGMSAYRITAVVTKRCLIGSKN